MPAAPTDRLAAYDASFLYVEAPHAAMHVGSVMVFAGDDGPLEHERLVEILRARLPYVPRYRQRLRTVPGGLASPVWVTDADVDLDYHVRRAALPRPGRDEQLQEFVARVQARPLDRSRPLWEVYLVEGLEHDRFAIVTKVHQALVDGVHAVDIAQVILDDSGLLEHRAAVDWTPGQAPSDLELVSGAVLGALRSPARAVQALRGGIDEVTSTASRVFGVAGQVAGTLVRSATRPPQSSPLNATIGSARRFVMIGVDLSAVRSVRNRYDGGPSGEHVSVNDVILATIAGALRTWLEARGEVVSRSTSVRALVPVSVHDTVSPDDGASPGSRVMACLVDLPVGEPAPPMRLHQIAYQMRRQMEGGRAVGATTLSGLAGFAAPTLHALGSRLSTAMTRRLFNVVVTNAPGPQRPLHVDGHQMVSTFPVVPLVDGQALAIGISSYDGGVYVGLNADRDAMPDVDVLGAAFVEALDELRLRR